MLITAAIIGAVIGGVSYVAINLYNGTAITWGGLTKSILVGAVSGAATAGIGQIAQSATTAIFGTFKSATLNWLALAVTKGLMHGVAQGFIQGVSGGNAGQSFLTAMATSIAGDAFGAIGGYADTVVGHSLFGTVAGGVTSRLQGGNFWEGAAIGLTVGLLNHAGSKLYPAIDRLLNGNQNKTILEIVYQRINETENSTTGTYYIEGTDVKGYFLEPSGPSTTQSNQDKRIPAGKYYLKINSGKKYGLKIYNSDVPQSRAILIHIGNYPSDTVGCLLPGKTLGVDFVGNSGTALKDIMSAYYTLNNSQVELRLKVIDIKK